MEGSPLLCLNSYFLGNDGSVGRRVLGRTWGSGVAGAGETIHGNGWGCVHEKWVHYWVG